MVYVVTNWAVEMYDLRHEKNNEGFAMTILIRTDVYKRQVYRFVISKEASVELCGMWTCCCLLYTSRCV